LPADFKFVARHPALITDDYEFELDEYKRESGEQLLLAHILINHWSHAVFKRIFRDWKVLRQCVRAPLFAVPKHNDEKWHKFVTALGFRPLMEEVACENGEKRPVYIHTVS
jgi:hypothetical protein